MDIFERIQQNEGGPLGQYRKRAKGYFMFPKLEGEIQPYMTFQGKKMLAWTFNNYLGLANDPEVRKVDADLEKKVITITYDAQKISPEKMILSLNATKRYIPTTYSVSDVITRTVSYRSDDMKCANCAKKVEKAIQTYAGVDSVGVDLDKKVVTVKYDANKVSKSTFEQTFDKLGYLTTTFYPNEIVGYARYTVKAGKLDEESKQQLIDNVEGLVELSSIPTSNVIAVAYDKRTLKDADAVKTALEGKGYSLDIQ